ncbi:MAG TPA: hypothetical protein VN873_07060 [Candidatus Angelobacter sp.]|nr:hypothetical protein [Candidatus Angelobacter sp.]
MACKLNVVGSGSGDSKTLFRNFFSRGKPSCPTAFGNGSGRLGTILVADRDKDDVWLLSYALKGAGIKNPVRWLSDIDEVIQFLGHGVRRSAKFTSIPEMPLLLFVEWNIPWSGAVDLLKWIRQEPRFLALLIVVITKSDDPEQKRLAYEAGADWHFVKSKDFSDLMRLVHRLREFWSCAVEAGFHEQPAER